MGKNKRPSVFLSYSHDSDAHKKLVQQIQYTLKKHGIICIADFDGEGKQSWTDWMANNIEHSDFILCVITKKYKKRFNAKKPPKVGKGVVWEAQLIKTKLTNCAVPHYFIELVSTYIARNKQPFSLYNRAINPA